MISKQQAIENIEELVNEYADEVVSMIMITSSLSGEEE